MKFKQFKLGDTLTYRHLTNALNPFTLETGYYYKSKDRYGEKCELIEYGSYIDQQHCWSIYVSGPFGHHLMLEREFEEYCMSDTRYIINTIQLPELKFDN